MKKFFLLLLCLLILIPSVSTFIIHSPEVIITEPTKSYFDAVYTLGFNPNPDHLNLMISKAEKIDVTLVLALVAKESSFRETAINKNRNKSNDYGYFQLNNEWHPQYKDNVESHIDYGIDFLIWCINTEKGNIEKALSRYNTGNPNSKIGKKYAESVLKIKDNILELL